MENRAHALTAGLFTLLLGLAGALSIWWFGGRHEATTDYTVVTRRNVTGLSLQGQVRYRGIRVGKVQAIELDPQDARNILIRISVDSGVPLTRATIARLGYQGVTGIAHVLLEDSGDNPTRLTGGDDGARIEMKPSLIEELSDTGGDALGQARDFLVSANHVLDLENRQHLARILANLEAASGNANEVTVQLRQLLSPENIQRWHAILAHAERAAAEAAPLLAESRSLLARWQPIGDRVERLIGEPAPGGIATLVFHFNEVASDLSANSRQLDRLLQLLEQSPQSFLFGPPRRAAGPGEAGFRAPPGEGGAP
ncbi:MAG TPA: MlaD family protein [Accumulibacter sp.]|uniref:MlaD family protein n=1 Tax=Accumulibacter sp. TaxID=2053492 RepID=UPI0025D4DD72|nr:MlaD family protein [Accumulibacter sp.]MCM8599763.1 MlaD family protein [Accumulibacter sp.]MCM8663866.1 MlaD family protein [Accumulibacter sp.]HNC51348.1 MlaD family protein [Accumulibacter sp.]